MPTYWILPKMPRPSENKSNFPLNNLPYSLRIGVFEHCRPNELLNFLQLDRELRHYTLANGPFQKQARSASVGLGIRGNDEKRSYLRIQLTLDGPWQQFDFMVDDGRDSWTRNIKGKTEIIQLRFSESPMLLRRLPFCRDLMIRDNPNCEEGFQGFPVSMCDFMPQFVGKCLEELYVRVLDTRLAAAVFRRIDGREVAKLSYTREGFDPINQQEIEMMEGPLFPNYFAKNLSDCSSLGLNASRLESTRLFTDPSLPKANVKSITITSRNADDFYKFTSSVLKYGIPSRSACAEIDLTVSLRKGDELPEGFKLFTAELRRVARRVDDPEIQKRIIPKFSMAYSMNAIMRNRLFDSGFYKRRFGKDQEYFYVYFQLDDRFFAYVKSEPIL